MPKKPPSGAKKSEGSVRRMGVKEDIIRGLADGLFNEAWDIFEYFEPEKAEQSEDQITSTPETPPEVVAFARSLVDEIEQQNDVDFEEFMQQAENQAWGPVQSYGVGYDLARSFISSGNTGDTHGLTLPDGDFTILDHDPDNNAFEFFMEKGSMTNKKAQAELYRPVVTLLPSGEQITGEWTDNPDVAKSMGQGIGEEVAKADPTTSFTVDVETSSQAPESGQPLAPDLGEADWESALKGLGSKKKRAAFPIFSDEGRNYIRLNTSMHASQEGIPASLEQAIAYINKGVAEVTKDLAVQLEDNVRAVIYEDPKSFASMVKEIFPQFKDLKDEELFKFMPGGGPVPAAIPGAPTPQPAPQPVATPQPLPPPPQGEAPTAAASSKLPQPLQAAFDGKYAYDAIATTLKADLGDGYPKRYKADELIDEEEFILDVVQQAFPEIPRATLTQAFGDVLTDSYNPQS